MKCFCGSDTRRIKFPVGKIYVFMVCCIDTIKCGLNSNWQDTLERAITIFQLIKSGKQKATEGKKCKRCGETKNLDEYYLCKTSRDGFQGICKKCMIKHSQKNKGNRK